MSLWGWSPYDGMGILFFFLTVFFFFNFILFLNFKILYYFCQMGILIRGLTRASSLCHERI